MILPALSTINSGYRRSGYGTRMGKLSPYLVTDTAPSTQVVTGYTSSGLVIGGAQGNILRKNKIGQHRVGTA